MSFSMAKNTRDHGYSQENLRDKGATKRTYIWYILHGYLQRNIQRLKDTNLHSIEIIFIGLSATHNTHLGGYVLVNTYKNKEINVICVEK